MDLAGVIAVLLDKAPYLLGSILGFCMVLIGSSGKFRGEALDQRTKSNIIKVGWIVFWTFLIIYSLELSSSGALSNLLNSLIRFVSSPISQLIIGLIGLLLLGLNRMRTIQIEKGYKIQSIPVIKFDEDRRSKYKEANAQVVNVGKGKIRCIAQIVKVIYTDFHGGKSNQVPMDKLNPDGKFLEWKSTGGSYADLMEGIPDNVRLLHSYRETYTYSEKMVFTFADNLNSKPIPFGEYTIRVDFLRWNGTRYIKFSEFEETLKVAYDEFSWIKTKKGDA